MVQSRRLPTTIVCGVLLKKIDVARLSPSEVGILSRWTKIVHGRECTYCMGLCGINSDIGGILITVVRWGVGSTLFNRIESICRLAFD